MRRFFIRGSRWLSTCLCVLTTSQFMASSLEAQAVPETGKIENDLIFIDTAFENASPVYYQIDKDSTTVYLMYDHERNSMNRAAGHMHIRLETKPGAQLQLEIRNLDNIYNGRPGSVAKEMHSLVVSPDGKSWTPIKTEVFEDHVKVQLNSPGSQLYLARVEPYRLSDLDVLLARVKTSTHAEVSVIGKTVEGRDVDMIRIGEESAPYHVFLRARAHAWEAGGNWIVEGLIDAALAETSEAQRFRRNCCLWILPLANKDAVARGRTRFNMRGRDLNRDWTEPADKATSPENYALERWLEARLDQGKRVHFALEIHNDGNGRLHLNSPPENDRARYQQRMQRFEELLRQHTWFSVGTTQVMHGTGTLANGWQNRFGIDGAVHEFNCQVIERLNEAPLARHWKEYGRGLTNVFRDFFMFD